MTDFELGNWNKERMMLFVYQVIFDMGYDVFDVRIQIDSSRLLWTEKWTIQIQRKFANGTRTRRRLRDVTRDLNFWFFVWKNISFKFVRTLWICRHSCFWWWTLWSSRYGNFPDLVLTITVWTVIIACSSSSFQPSPRAMWSLKKVNKICKQIIYQTETFVQENFVLRNVKFFEER